MMFIWMSAILNVYMVSFLVNTFQNEYASAIGSSCADVLSMIIAGFMFAYFDLKKNYIGIFAESTLGGILVWVWGLNFQNSWLFLGLIFVAKFGISCAW